MSISKLLFGEIALKKGLVTREQVDECLEIQKKLKDMGIDKSLGAIMHDKKFLNMVEVKEVLRDLGGEGDWNAIQGYEILEKLGKGGMGQVYRARHMKLNRDVAIKILTPDQTQNPEFIERFTREAMAAARLNHPNIVQAFDIGESYGFHYFVMEFVRGLTLREVIEQRTKLSDVAIIEIAYQMAQAMDHYGQAGLVHRDIKPANIIINVEGVCKLCDMGLAKSVESEDTGHITQTGVIMGTPYFISPEQARSEKLDIRSDIYSLGVTLFHAGTGQLPFTGNSAATILYKHIFLDAPKPRSLNPDISESLEQIIERMMAKSPDDRYASPLELAKALEPLRKPVDLKELVKDERLAVREEKPATPHPAAPVPTNGGGAADDGKTTAVEAAGAVATEERGGTIRMETPRKGAEAPRGEAAEAAAAAAAIAAGVPPEAGDRTQALTDEEPAAAESKGKSARDRAREFGMEVPGAAPEGGATQTIEEGRPSREGESTQTIDETPVPGKGKDAWYPDSLKKPEGAGEDWRKTIVPGAKPAKGEAKAAPAKPRVPSLTPEEVERLEKGDAALKQKRKTLRIATAVTLLLAAVVGYRLFAASSGLPARPGLGAGDPVPAALEQAGAPQAGAAVDEARALAAEGRYGAAADRLAEVLAADPGPADAFALLTARTEIVAQAETAFRDASSRLDAIEAQLLQDIPAETRTALAEERTTLTERIRSMEVERLYRALLRDLPPASR